MTADQAATRLLECKRMIAKIDARGGPVPGTEREYERVRRLVDGQLTMLDDPALGGLLTLGFTSLLLAAGGYLLWQVQNTAVVTVNQLLETAGTVGKVALWSGLGWLGWQMFGPQRRSSYA